MHRNKGWRWVAWAVAIAVPCGLPLPVLAANGWEWADPRPQGNHLWAVTQGAGLWVAVGAYGTVVTSPDAETWTLRDVDPLAGGETQALLAVAWADPGFVAVGALNDSTAYVVTSSDGVVWTRRETPDLPPLASVVWDGSRFVAVGGAWGYLEGGVVAASADGASWEILAQPVSPLGDLVDVTWTGGRYIAIGFVCIPDFWFGCLYGGEIWVSNDAVEWTRTFEGAWLSPVAWTGERALVCSDDGVLSSNDGSSWEWVRQGYVDVPVDLIWSGSEFIGTLHWSGLVSLGADGSEWRPLCEGPQCRGLDGLHASREVTVAVGPTGSILTSRDGLEWVERAPGFRASLDAVTWTGRQAVAVGTSYSGPNPAGAVATSADGLSWTGNVVEGIPELQPLVWTGERLVAVGDQVCTSSDAASWECQPVPVWPLNGLMWTGELLVVGGGGSRVLTSRDGLSWSVHQLPHNDRLVARAHNGRRIVVARGDHGYSYFSRDGTTWTGCPGRDAWSVVWAGSRFLTVGAASPDGCSWSSWTVPDELSRTLHLEWTGESLIGVGRDGRFAESPDGVAWTVVGTGAEQWLEDIVATGDSLLAVGGSAILRKAVAPPPPPTVTRSTVLVPAVAAGPGQSGTRWRTELVMLNPNPEPVTATLWFVDRRLGLAAAHGRRVRVEAGHEALLFNLLHEWFFVDHSAGALLVEAEPPLLVDSTTFTTAAGGRYGQRVPGFDGSRALRGGETAWLPMLTVDDRYRTNLGLASRSDRPTSVAVEVRRVDGSPAASFSVELPPLGWKQWALELAEELADGYALVSPAGEQAELLIYASVVDNLSGDAVFVLPVEPASEPLVIPAAAHAVGLGSTLWRTDLEVLNPGPVAAFFRVELLGETGLGPSSPGFMLAPGAAMRYRDALTELLAVEGRGALRVVPLEGEVAVTSRTYDDRGQRGTCGQLVPALSESDAIAAGEPAWLLQLSSANEPAAGFRTNLGFVNLGDQPIAVAVEVYASDASDLGGLSLDLCGRCWRQLDGMAEILGEQEVDIGYATVRSDTVDARFIAYASVVDNRSDDSIFVLAVTDAR